MFISFSKTIARFGGFRLGVGMRLSKKNAIWMSLIVLFVAMFQLMWYMLILCGWMMYAVCYGIYWCIKKTIGALSKKQNNKQFSPTIKKTTQNLQTERKEETPTMTPEMNNSPNENPNNKSPKKKSAIVRWIVGGFFAMFALVNGFHFSSLFLLLSALLMFPLSFIENFLKKINVKTVIAIILSIVLFFVGVLTAPSSDSSEDHSNNTNQGQTEDNNNQNSENANNSQSGNNNTENNTNNNTNDNSTTIRLLSPSNYNGPECWLLNESNSIIEVYAKIETTNSNWKESCKTVFSMLIDEFEISTDFSNAPNIMLKIYNSKDNMSNNQPDYSHLIALWESHPTTYISESAPKITYYPNGAGMNAKQESENWPISNITNNDEKVEMVWIPSSGTKYHSKSTCSGMNSPRQIPLEDAIKQGYTACKKCH